MLNIRKQFVNCTHSGITGLTHELDVSEISKFLFVRAFFQIEKIQLESPIATKAISILSVIPMNSHSPKQLGKPCKEKKTPCFVSSCIGKNTCQKSFQQ